MHALTVSFIVAIIFVLLSIFVDLVTTSIIGYPPSRMEKNNQYILLSFSLRVDRIHTTAMFQSAFAV